MPEIKITSHNQTGGITAQNVNSSMVAPTATPAKQKKIWPYLVEIFSILAAIIAILTYFGLKPKGV